MRKNATGCFEDTIFKKMQRSEQTEKIHATAQQAISKTYDISLENRDFMQHAASNTLL